MSLRFLFPLLFAVLIAGFGVTGAQALQGGQALACDTMEMGTTAPPISDGCCDESCLLAPQSCWQCAPAMLSDGLGFATYAHAKTPPKRFETSVRAKTLSQPETPPPRN